MIGGSIVVLTVAVVLLLLDLALTASDAMVRRLSAAVALGLALLVLFGMFSVVAGCSPSEPYGHAAVELAEVLGG